MSGKNTKFRTEVGVRLRLAREALGLSQEDLGQILGCNGNQVSQIETGTRGLNPEKAAALKRARGVSLDYLFADDASALDKTLFRGVLKIVQDKPADGKKPRGKAA